MFVHSLQRRAFGIELWAVVPTRDHVDRTFFIRMPTQDQPDRHFTDADAALEEFFRTVQAAMADGHPAEACRSDGAPARVPAASAPPPP